MDFPASEEADAHRLSFKIILKYRANQPQANCIIALLWSKTTVWLAQAFQPLTYAYTAPTPIKHNSIWRWASQKQFLFSDLQLLYNKRLFDVWNIWKPSTKSEKTRIAHSCFRQVQCVCSIQPFVCPVAIKTVCKVKAFRLKREQKFSKMAGSRVLLICEWVIYHEQQAQSWDELTIALLQEHPTSAFNRGPCIDRGLRRAHKLEN